VWTVTCCQRNSANIAPWQDGDGALARSSSARSSATRGISTAAKYRNQDGNQQTSADVNGQTATVRAEVFKRRFGGVN
jgi:hypothetical protein